MLVLADHSKIISNRNEILQSKKIISTCRHRSNLSLPSIYCCSHGKLYLRNLGVSEQRLPKWRKTTTKWTVRQMAILVAILHQPFRNCKLLLVYQWMRRATSLIHTSEIKILRNLPSVIAVVTFVNVKTLIMFILFLEQARGWPPWSLRVTWCPQAPRWWPLLYCMLSS